LGKKKSKKKEKRRISNPKNNDGGWWDLSGDKEPQIAESKLLDRSSSHSKKKGPKKIRLVSRLVVYINV